MELLCMTDIANLSRKQIHLLIAHRYGVVSGYRTIDGVCVLYRASSAISVSGFGDVLWFFPFGARVLMVSQSDAVRCRCGNDGIPITDDEGSLYRLRGVEENAARFCGFDITISPL